MENKHTTKHLMYSVMLIAFILGSFAGGYGYGVSKTYYELSVPDLKNKNALNVNIDAVDFAPFWKAWNILNERYVASASSTEQISDQDKVWGAIQGLASSLGDPYTTFFPPVEAKEFTEQVSGNFSGIGAELSIKDSALVVISPLKDSPAEKAGLRPEDIILAIDNTSASGITIDDAISKIRGEKGTKVMLTVLHKTKNEPTEITIVRDDIQVPVIKTEHKADDHVFVISLYSFSANSAYQFRDALQEFVNSGEKNLIIDLRNNPGGYLESAISMASWFLPEGEVIVTEDFGQGKEPLVHRSKGYNVFKKGLYNVVILQNGGSASASEILAGALHEHGVAQLVGTKSFGKGSVQELVDVTPTTSLKVTIARWLTPHGHSISHNGLEPDYLVEFTEKDIDNRVDVQMKKAVEVLNKK